MIVFLYVQKKFKLNFKGGKHMQRKKIKSFLDKLAEKYQNERKEDGGDTLIHKTRHGFLELRPPT